MTANDNAKLAPAPPPLPPALPAPPAVEVWSGKDRGDENFPVGSFLIRADLRPHIHAYYQFARNADDIADSPSLSPREKIARLETMEAVLTGARDEGSPSAARLRASLAQTGVSPVHARELLIAFRQDAVKNRYANWAELMDYCRYSAAPVGRYVLALHGEAPATWPASDALCASLQVLNHMQDAAGDLRNLDRCYIPADWMQTEGTSVDDLARPELSAPMRAVLGRMLERVRVLNTQAAALPPAVRARRLRVETAVILRLARRLTVKLAAGDPLATRVKLQKIDFLAAGIGALGQAL